VRRKSWRSKCTFEKKRYAERNFEVGQGKVNCDGPGLRNAYLKGATGRRGRDVVGNEMDAGDLPEK